MSKALKDFHTAASKLDASDRMSAAIEIIAATFLADIPQEKWCDALVKMSRDLGNILDKAASKPWPQS